MVWSTLALATYQLRFVSMVFHVIFSFVHFISLYTLGGLRAFTKPLPYNMYLFKLRMANHILIKIFLSILSDNPTGCSSCGQLFSSNWLTHSISDSMHIIDHQPGSWFTVFQSCPWNLWRWIPMTEFSITRAMEFTLPFSDSSIFPTICILMKLNLNLNSLSAVPPYYLQNISGAQALMCEKH